MKNVNDVSERKRGQPWQWFQRYLWRVVHLLYRSCAICLVLLRPSFGRTDFLSHGGAKGECLPIPVGYMEKQQRPTG